MYLEDFLNREHSKYDFKNESPTNKVRNENNPIRKFFEYKHDSKKSKFDCDRCQLAKEIYLKLWNIDKYKLNFYDFDTMNSFYRIYRLLLISYDADYWNNAKISVYPTRYKWILKKDILSQL